MIIQSKTVVGCDFGGVICDNHKGRGHREVFTNKEIQEYCKTRIFVEGAIDTISAIIRVTGPENFFIVSRCTKQGEKVIMAWLEYHNFFELTCMNQENIHFCREREDKAQIVSDLKISLFIDDRWEVLKKMKKSTTKVLFNSLAEERLLAANQRTVGFYFCPNWTDLKRALLP